MTLPLAYSDVHRDSFDGDGNASLALMDRRRRLTATDAVSTPARAAVAARRGMNVCVIGTGHVGLITSAVLAKLGHRVTGMDCDEQKIALLSRGTAPFYEPGLEELLTEQMSSGRLSFTASPAEALPDADVVFICVGTPPRASGEASLLAVENGAREVARHGRDGVVVVEKSTVPAGTAERVRLTLSHESPRLKFRLVSNPEFLREGRAIDDSLRPDRILIGADNARAFQVMRRLYRPLLTRGCQLIETDIATAELAKHACNAFLSLKISFANALAAVCERAGADVRGVADVMGSDPRIGRAFLDAGLGYGGYCFPKDLVALQHLSARLGYDFRLLSEVARINDGAVEAVVEKVREALWNLEGKKVALLGLAFKAGTDDTRFAPALSLARRLLAQGARVVGYDPQAADNAKAELPALEIADDPYEAAWGAHCLVLCTEWDEFRGLDLSVLKEIMLYPVVVDGRNFFDPAAMANKGFFYYPIGRPPVLPRADGRHPAARRRGPARSSLPQVGQLAPWRTTSAYGDGDGHMPSSNGDGHEPSIGNGRERIDRGRDGNGLATTHADSAANN